LLYFFLGQYAFAVFGYMTAGFATFFVGRDAENDEAELAEAKQLAAHQEEVVALRNHIGGNPEHKSGKTLLS
jgi:voltage-gated potassium channel